MSEPRNRTKYAYVRNSPLMMTDPTGLEGEPPGCNPYDPSCPGAPPCTSYYCGPGILPDPVGPIVTTVVSSAPPLTTGLPNGGIFATGPGVDYSWLGLLSWALGLNPCGPQFGLGSLCIMNQVQLATLNGTDNIVGTENGDVLPGCAYSDAQDFCEPGDQPLYWNAWTGQWQWTRPPVSPYNTFLAMGPDQKNLYDLSLQMFDPQGVCDFAGDYGFGTALGGIGTLAGTKLALKGSSVFKDFESAREGGTVAGAGVGILYYAIGCNNP